MNRFLTACNSVIDAAVAVITAFAFAAIPLAVMWAAQYGFSVDVAVFWRAAVDMWMLGAGVPITVTLDAATAALFGFADPIAPFVVSLMPLFLALCTVFLGYRSGVRSAGGSYPVLAVIVGCLTYECLAVLIALGGQHPAAAPSVSHVLVVPLLIYGASCFAGWWVQARKCEDRWARIPFWDEGSEWLQGVVVSSLRAGTASVVALVGVAAIVLGVLLIGGYPGLVSLFETIHSGVAGGIALTVAQALFIPNIVMWLVAWLIGPGFAVGTGSLLSPFGTVVGPVPGVPIVSVLPVTDGPLTTVSLAIPALIGVCIAVFSWRTAVATCHGTPGVPWLAAFAAGTGTVAGVAVAVLCWLSSGSAGPGLLSSVGPHPFAVGGVFALEIAASVFATSMVARYAPVSQAWMLGMRHKVRDH